MARPIARETEDAQASEALADIALNTLGLILMVLFVYILLFQNKSQALARSQAAAHGASQVESPDLATLEQQAHSQRQEVLRLNQKVEQLQRESDAALQAAAKADAAKVAALKAAAEATAKSNQEIASDLWCFQVNVRRLVAGPGQSAPCDFQIEYFVHLIIKGRQVRGTLFGIKELDRKSEGASATHAHIVGTNENGHLELELQFTGAATGGSEKLIVDRKGEEYIGRLVSGRNKSGYQNYEGNVVGKKLTDSVFVK